MITLSPFVKCGAAGTEKQVEKLKPHKQSCELSVNIIYSVI